MKDLTKGYPAKIIIFLAIPFMLGNILQQFYNLADAKIVSYFVGTDAYTAVGATIVLNSTILGFMNGFCQGFAIPVSQAFGAKDEKRMRVNVAGSIILVVAITIIVFIAAQLLIEPLLKILSTPSDIIDDAVSYLKIICLGIVFTSNYNFWSSMLRGVGDSKTPLYCLIVSVIINIITDVLFVGIFDWGIQGAAYATLLAQFLCNVVLLVFVFKKYKKLLPKKDDWREVTLEMYTTQFTIGFSMAIMLSIVNIGSIVLQGSINDLGKDIVTAHTGARNIFSVITVIIYSISVSMTSYTAQNIGAKRYDRVNQGVRHSIIIACIVSALIVAFCFLFSDDLLRFIISTDNPDIIEPAYMYLRISSCFFFVLGALCILRSVLQGMGQRVTPIISSVLEMAVKIISASFLVPVFKYVGVSFTEPVSWVLMTIWLVASYIVAIRKLSRGVDNGKTQTTENA